jgi:hypothetical protein
MFDSNPYAPTVMFSCKFDSFARSYCVDNSRATLEEFRNLSGKPLLGTIFWLLMRSGLVKPARLVVDGPRPFRDSQCTIDELKDPVRGQLLALQDAAKRCGFHSLRYSVANSSGIHGGAIRMLHDDSRMFLQILASSCGPTIQGYQLLISAAANSNCIFVSSNGRPNYNASPNIRTHRIVGAPLCTLVEHHDKMLDSVSEDLLLLGSFDVVGTVMDYLSTQFFEDKINRGIYIAES